MSRMQEVKTLNRYCIYEYFKPQTDAKEMRAVKTSLQKSGDNFYKDIVWVLVNSHEFLFVQ